MSESSKPHYVLQTLKDRKVAILIIYVDDIILTGDDDAELEGLKKKLVDDFKIKYLGALKYFLGMEFARSMEDIFVSQQKYIVDLVKQVQWVVKQLKHQQSLT